MKKPKVNFDSAKIKAFFAEHGEKFLVAIAVAILVSFGISAINRETLPENLRAPSIKTRASNAQVAVNSSKPPAKIVPNLDYVGGVAAWSAGIQPSAYKLSNPLSVPAFADPVKRTDPALLAVTEVQVVTFVGAVPMNAALAPPVAPAGPVAPAPNLLHPAPTPTPKTPARDIRAKAGASASPGGLPGVGGLPGIGNVQAGPQPIPPAMRLPGPQSTGYAEFHEGVIVTGLIPVEAQQEEYERVFEHARRASADASAGTAAQRAQSMRDTDTPRYVWCRLERTDTTDGSVKVIDFGDVPQVTLDWKYPERRKAIAAQIRGISPEFKKLEADMKNWGMQVPDVIDPDYAGPWWLTWPLPPVLLHDWGRDAAHAKIPLATADATDATTGATKASGDQDPFADPNNPAGPGPAGPRRPPRSMNRMGPGMMPNEGLRGGDDVGAPAVPYKLFRFVDMDVLPTHAYQYRVQLLLKNPNYGLEPQLLAKPDLNAPIYRETPWSEKSPVATFPAEVQLVSVGIDRQRRIEPKGNLGILLWDKPDALQLLKKTELELGDVANFGEQKVKDVVDVVTRTVRDVSADFNSGAVLVDMRGNDEKLPGTDSLTDPGELLLLTDIAHPDKMQFIVLNEAFDRSSVEAWDRTHKVPPALAAPANNGIVAPQGIVKPPPTGLPKTPGQGIGLPPIRNPVRPTVPNKTGR